MRGTSLPHFPLPPSSALRRPLNIGIQSGLLDPRHIERMKKAVWMYLWCVRCQTQRDGGKWVLGGMPLTYDEMARRSGFSARNIRYWLNRLRAHGYVIVHYAQYKKMRIEITKPKKWPSSLTVNSQSSKKPSNRQRIVNKNDQKLSIRMTKSSQFKQSCSSLRKTEPEKEAVLPSVLPLETQKGLPLDRAQNQPPVIPQAQPPETITQAVEQMIASGTKTQAEINQLRILASKCERLIREHREGVDEQKWN